MEFESPFLAAVPATLTLRHSPEFPIVSSSSSRLEEPVYVIEEPNEYNAKPSEDIFLRLPEKFLIETNFVSFIEVASFFRNN